MKIEKGWTWKKKSKYG